MTDLKKIKKTIKKIGLGNFILDLIYTNIQKIIYFKVLKGMIYPSSKALAAKDEATLPDGLRWGSISISQLREFSRGHPEIMPEKFVDEFEKRTEDLCYGVTKGRKVVSFSFYALKTCPKSDELMIHFNPNYCYQYHGHTLPEYRGLRLHSYNKKKTLLALLTEMRSTQRCLGLLSSVEFNNFPSLKSSSHLGKEPFGTIIVLRLLGKFLVFSSPGCKKYDFKVLPASKAEA